MHRHLISLLFLLTAMFATACSKPADEAVVDEPSANLQEPMVETAPEAQPAETAMTDPTEADPDHYTNEFENDAVRILRIKYGPGEESVMHYHPDSVAVYLADVEGQFTLPDGTVEDASAPAGSVFFGPAGSHQPRNTGDTAFEVVEVELKARAPGTGEAGGDDPVLVDPDHYSVEFENDAVRVLRIAYGPGEESVMHYHPDGVAIFVTDHEVEMNLPDGSAPTMTASAGEAAFVDAGQHRPKNIAEEPVEVVLIELK